MNLVRLVMRNLRRDSICFKARIEKVFQELKSILSENKKLIVSSSLTNVLAYSFKMLSIKNKRWTFISQSWNLLFFPIGLFTILLPVDNWVPMGAELAAILLQTWTQPNSLPKKNSEWKDQITYSCFKYDKSMEVIQRRFETGKDV